MCDLLTFSHPPFLPYFLKVIIWNYFIMYSDNWLKDFNWTTITRTIWVILLFTSWINRMENNLYKQNCRKISVNTNRKLKSFMPWMLIFHWAFYFILGVSKKIDAFNWSCILSLRRTKVKNKRHFTVFYQIWLLLNLTNLIFIFKKDQRI